MVEKSREQIVQEALPKAISYQEYRQLMDDHAAQETSTGPNQTEALTNYTMLNQRRMKRLDKTTKIKEEDITKIKDFKGDVTWLVITESWCGDAVRTMIQANNGFL